MSIHVGLDVGGVIIDALRNDGTDTDLHGVRFLDATPVVGAFTGGKKLVQLYGAQNVSIVSKCGEAIEHKTRLWLAGNGFYRYTGFDPKNLIFCRTRAEKALIAKEKGLTHFVDDKAEVLKHMEGIVPFRYLFGPQRDKEQDTDGMIVVENWEEALKAILQEA